jgi:hypothetical protein
MSPDENSYSFLLCPKMMTATSTEQRTDSSCAFLKRPPLRFKKVLDNVSNKSQEAHGVEVGVHGAVAVILDGLDLDLSTTHDEYRTQASTRIERGGVCEAATAVARSREFVEGRGVD